jgi:tryptophan-rich sensory protein
MKNTERKGLEEGISLIIWILALIAIGLVIGSLAKAEISTWYKSLRHSSLTPPNYAFSVVWTILYAAIGACGWVIWGKPSSNKLRVLKTLYAAQLILNWSWTPVFFNYHLTGVSLIILGGMDILVGGIILISYPKPRSVWLLMVPYFLWILFASYLNFYIWWYN